MGFRFRKSKSFGPFKVNVSKSGIGWSVGTKGARYTKRADGKTQTTFSVPGTGISYVDVSGGKKGTSNNNFGASNAFSSFSSGSNNKNNNPFYKRMWFMWLMLFVFPPVGIILMWLYSGYKKAPKIALSICFAIFTIVRFPSGSSSTSNNTHTTATALESTKNIDTKSNSAKTEELKTVLTGWQQEGNSYYYYDANGVKKSGWIEDKNKKYYLSSTGVMQTGWIQDNKKDYYLDENGVMQTGWVEYKNKYYYLDTKGEMKTGWIQDKNNWYYLNSDGSMATSTNKDGYSIASNGVATKIVETTTQSSNQTSSSSSSSSGKTASSSSNSSGSWSSSGDVTTYEPAKTGTTVYWTPSGKSYHSRNTCPSLSRSKNILSGDSSQCPKTDPCNNCVK